MGQGMASGIPSKIPMGISGVRLPLERKGGDVDEGGRRAVVILFLLTVGLSLLFWVQRRLTTWISDFFGPSTWTRSP